VYTSRVRCDECNEDRKADIDQHYIGYVGACRLQCVPAIRDEPDVVPQEFQDHHQALRRVGIVLDHEHARSRTCLPTGLGTLRGNLRRNVRQGGNLEHELGSLADPIASDVHGAAMQFGNRPNECESDAEATFGPIERARTLSEEVEHARQGIGGDAATRIPNRNHRLARFPTDANSDRAARVRILHSVRDEIADGLFQATGVRVHEDRVVGQVDDQRVVALVYQRLSRIKRAAHYLLERNARLLQRHTALRDTSHVE
jgi:hypothetical protein